MQIEQHQLVVEKHKRLEKDDLQKLSKGEVTELEQYFWEQFERAVRIEKRARIQIAAQLAPSYYRFGRVIQSWLKEKYKLESN